MMVVDSECQNAVEECLWEIIKGENMWSCPELSGLGNSENDANTNGQQ